MGLYDLPTIQVPEGLTSDSLLNEYTPLPDLPKPETGYLEGIARSGTRGIGGALETVGRWGQSDYGEGTDALSRVGKFVEGVGTTAKGLVDAPVANDPSSQKAMMFGAAESLVPSMTYGLPTFAAGVAGGALGAAAGIETGPGAIATGLAGRAAASSAMAGAMHPLMKRDATISAYRMSKQMRPDLPEDQHRAFADKYGHWEAAPEASGNVLEATLFGGLPVGKVGTAGIKLLKDSFKPTVGTMAKTLAKNQAVSLPVEMGTEAITGYGQAKAQKDAGIARTPEELAAINPLDEALRGANTAMYMSGGTAVAGTAVGRVGQSLQYSALFDKPAGDGGKLQDVAFTNLLADTRAQVGEDAAENLMHNYHMAMMDGKPLAFDESIFADPFTNQQPVSDNQQPTTANTPLAAQDSEAAPPLASDVPVKMGIQSMPHTELADAINTPPQADSPAASTSQMGIPPGSPISVAPNPYSNEQAALSDPVMAYIQGLEPDKQIRASQRLNEPGGRAIVERQMQEAMQSSQPAPMGIPAPSLNTQPTANMYDLPNTQFGAIPTGNAPTADSQVLSERINNLSLGDVTHKGEFANPNFVPQPAAPQSDSATSPADVTPAVGTPIGASQHRTLNEYGEVTNGIGIKPKEQFSTSSGRVTTPFPHQKGEKYASQWLIDNAVAEAEARGDDFNARIFRSENTLKRGDLAPASKDSMTMYLFGQQPKVIPSILKPLAQIQPTGVPEVQAASAPSEVAQPQTPLQPAIPANWRTEPAANGVQYFNSVNDRLTPVKDGTFNLHDTLGGIENFSSLEKGIEALHDNEKMSYEHSPEIQESSVAPDVEKSAVAPDNQQTAPVLDDASAKEIESVITGLKNKSIAYGDIQKIAEGATTRLEYKGKIIGYSEGGRIRSKTQLIDALQKAFDSKIKHDKLQKKTNTKVAKPISLDPSKHSMLEAISLLGGINKDQAFKEWHISEKDSGNSITVGGKALRIDGLSLDEMASRLEQYGYLQADENGKHDLNDLGEKLEKSLAGDKQYSTQNYQWVEAEVARMEEELYSMPEEAIQEEYDVITSGNESEIEQAAQRGTDKTAEESSGQKTADKIDESGWEQQRLAEGQGVKPQEAKGKGAVSSGSLEAMFAPNEQDLDLPFSNPMFSPEHVAKAITGLYRNLKTDMPKLLELAKHVVSKGNTRYTEFAQAMRGYLGAKWNKLKDVMVKVFNQAKAFLRDNRGMAGYDINSKDEHPGAKYEDISRPNEQEAEGHRRRSRDVRASIKRSSEINAAPGSTTDQRETGAVRQWAVAAGLLFDHAEFSNTWEEQGRLEGAEQQVVVDKIDGRKIATKRKQVGFGETWSIYLDRLDFHNETFPDTAYILEGFSDVPTPRRGELFMARVYQPFVERKVALDENGKPKLTKEGKPVYVDATTEQIRAYMEYKGFKSFMDPNMAKMGYGEDKFHFLKWIKGDIVVSDLHAGNVWLDVNGKIRIFDPIISKATAQDAMAASTESEIDNALKIPLTDGTKFSTSPDSTQGKGTHESTGTDTATRTISSSDRKAIEEAVKELEASANAKILSSTPHAGRDSLSLTVNARLPSPELAEVVGLFGKELVYVTNSRPDLFKFNGAVSQNNTKYIFVENNSSNPHLAVIGHELFHTITKEAPDIAKKFFDAINSEGKAFAEYRKSRPAGESFDYALEEFAADLHGNQFMDKQFWDKISKQTPGTFGKIVRFISGFIDSIKQKMSAMGLTNAYISDISKIQDAAVASFNEYAQRRGVVPIQTPGDVKFSTDVAAIRKQVDEFVENNSAMYIAKSLIKAANPLDFSRLSNGLERSFPKVSEAIGYLLSTPQGLAERDARKRKEGQIGAADVFETAQNRDRDNVEFQLTMQGHDGLKGVAPGIKQRLTEVFTQWDNPDVTTEWGRIQKHTYKDLTAKEKVALDVMQTEGDVHHIVYGSLEEAMQNRNIAKSSPTQAAFDAYQKVRNYLDGPMVEARMQLLDKLATKVGADAATKQSIIKEFSNHYANLKGWMPRKHGEGTHQVNVYHAIKELPFTASQYNEGHKATMPYHAGQEVNREIRKYAKEHMLLVSSDNFGAPTVYASDSTIDRLRDSIKRLEIKINKATDQLVASDLQEKLDLMQGKLADVSRPSDERIADFIEASKGFLGNIRQEYESALQPLRDKLDAARERNANKGEIAAIKQEMLRLGDGSVKVKVYMRLNNTETQAKKLKAQVASDLPTHLSHIFHVGEQYDTTYKVIDPVSESTFGDMAGDMAIERIITEATIKAQQSGEITDEEAEKVRNAIFQRTANTLMSRGAGRHQIKRASYLIQGYDTTDTTQLYSDYMSSAAGMLSKAVYAKDQFENYRYAEADIKPWIEKYIKDSLRVQDYKDRLGANARGVATFMYLGFKVSSVLVNMTQSWTLGVAELGRLTAQNSVKAIFGAQKDILSNKITKQDEIDLLNDKIWKEQEMATAIHEMSGQNGDVSGKASRWMHTFIGKSLMPFQEVELLNRKTMVLAAYRCFVADGMSKGEAIKKAMAVNDATNFVMGRANLPAWARNPAGRTVFALQSFAFNSMNWMYNRMSSGEKQDMLALLKYAGMVALIGGAAAVPGGDEANKLLRKMLGKDYRLEMENWTRRNSRQFGTAGELMNAAIWHGGMGALGVNISNAMRLNIPMSGFITGESTAGEAAMGVWSGLYKKGEQALMYAGKGQASRVAEALAPEAIAAPMKAYRMATQGATTTHGRPVFDENGKQVKYSTGEAVTRAFGLQPLEQSRRQELSQTEKKINSYWSEKRNTLLDKYRMARSRSEQEEINLEINKFNREVRKSQSWPLVKIIDASTRHRSLAAAKVNKHKMVWERNQLDN